MSETPDVPRAEVVDAILDSLGIDAFAGPEQQALIDSATGAEELMVSEILEAQLLGIIEAIESRDEQALEWIDAMPHGDLFADLPGPRETIEMIRLQKLHPWEEGELARMEEIAPLWSPAQRALLERRIGFAFPSGTHWPD